MENWPLKGGGFLFSALYIFELKYLSKSAKNK